MILMDLLVRKRNIDEFNGWSTEPEGIISHTVGPMRAARIFVTDLKHHHVLDKVNHVNEWRPVISDSTRLTVFWRIIRNR